MTDSKETNWRALHRVTQVDTEWDALLAWVRQWCEIHCCTRAAFIRHFNFPAAHVRFLYCEVPSKREGTIGNEFRKELAKLKQAISLVQTTPVSDTVMDQLQDHYFSHLDHWKKYGIRVIFEPDCIYVKADINGNGQGKFQELAQQTLEKSLKSNPDAKSPKVVEIPSEQYTTIKSDSNQEKIGTASLLFLDFAFGLTAGHNLTKEELNEEDWKSEIHFLSRCVPPFAENHASKRW